MDIPKKTWLAILFACMVTCSSSSVAKTEEIHCGEKPKEGVQALIFETVWEKPAEDESYLVGRVADALLGSKNNADPKDSVSSEDDVCILVYSKDSSNNHIIVFNGEGKWLRTIGRGGEGPGEWKDGRRLFLNIVDSRIQYGVLGLFGKIVWLNPDGTPAPNWRISEESEDSRDFSVMLAPSAVQVKSSLEIYAWLRKLESDGKNNGSVRQVSGDGRLGQVLYIADENDDKKDYRVWKSRWAPDGQKGVWVAPERDRYRLERWRSNDGKSEKFYEVERNYEQVTRAGKAMGKTATMVDGHGLSTDDIEPKAPVVKTLRLGDDGNLWVNLDLGGNYPTPDTIAVYDVISPEGVWLKQLHLRVPSLLVYTENEEETEGSGVTVDDWQLLDNETLLILSFIEEWEEDRLMLQKVGEVEILDPEAKPFPSSFH